MYKFSCTCINFGQIGYILKLIVWLKMKDDTYVRNIWIIEVRDKSNIIITILLLIYAYLYFVKVILAIIYA